MAWLIWLFIHLVPITSFRNKVKLAFSWFWSFITNDPTLRLIIRPQEELNMQEQNASYLASKVLSTKKQPVFNPRKSAGAQKVAKRSKQE